jgi:hypothetical protein
VAVHFVPEGLFVPVLPQCAHCPNWKAVKDSPSRRILQRTCFLVDLSSRDISGSVDYSTPPLNLSLFNGKKRGFVIIAPWFTLKQVISKIELCFSAKVKGQEIAITMETCWQVPLILVKSVEIRNCRKDIELPTDETRM